MTDAQFKKAHTIKKVINGIKITFIPIVYDCTYHQPNKKTGKCVNCNDTRKYIDGYYMVYESKGKKYAFTVDNIK